MYNAFYLRTSHEKLKKKRPMRMSRLRLQGAELDHPIFFPITPGYRISTIIKEVRMIYAKI